jgi:2-keto-4-pentenoate hydratase/2-oxohepta-3-ene-1,7-dioic acid hydratase in catechol pathway
MKIIRFIDASAHVRYGAQLPDGSRVELDGDPYEGNLRVTSRPADVRRLLAPVAPTNIFAVGLNYRQHAEESRMQVPEFPIIFMKGTNAVCAGGDAIILPRVLESTEVDYECELAVVIGKGGKNITRKDALKHVLGYTCANDVSARDWQLRRGGGQWIRGKTFDTFCPLGPCLVTPDEIPDGANSLSIKTILNGKTMQDWDTGDMIFDVPALIEFLSASTTLVPGTVILTGTPHGVGAAQKPPRWLKPGDTVTIDIEHIGELTNPVVEEQIAM